MGKTHRLEKKCYIFSHVFVKEKKRQKNHDFKTRYAIFSRKSSNGDKVNLKSIKPPYNLYHNKDFDSKGDFS